MIRGSSWRIVNYDAQSNDEMVLTQRKPKKLSLLECFRRLFDPNVTGMIFTVVPHILSFRLMPPTADGSP